MPCLTGFREKTQVFSDYKQWRLSEVAPSVMKVNEVLWRGRKFWRVLAVMHADEGPPICNTIVICCYYFYFFFYVPEIASDKEMEKLLVAMFSRFFYDQLFGERV